MRIIITGHTRGIGQYLYNYFSADTANQVIGLSRSNGYDLKTSLDRVLEITKGCDLFINNAYYNNAQYELVKQLNNHVGMIVVSGSQAGFFKNLIPTDYGKHKEDLKKLCHLVSLDKNSGTRILHLDLSYLEGNIVDLDDPNNLACDHITTFKEICDVINFWINNQSFNEVKFNFKLTDLLYDQIDKKMGTKSELDLLVHQINSTRDKSV
jgi:hypothetical protein